MPRGTIDVLRVAPLKFSLETLGLRLPVLVKGGATRMPAYDLWTDSYLREALDESLLIVRFPDGARGRIKAETFFDYLADPSAYSLERGWMYLTDFYLRPDFGEHHRQRLARAADFPLHRTGCLEWTSLYAGPAGTLSEFHQDVFSTFTWLALFRGRKRWILVDPSVCDPRSEPTRQVEIIQESGDLIVLPPDWWHEVHNLTQTVAVSGNFCSVAHGRTSYSEALDSVSPNREVWTRTWEEILRTQVVTT